MMETTHGLSGILPVFSDGCWVACRRIRAPADLRDQPLQAVSVHSKQFIESWYGAWPVPSEESRARW
jgi:hypothetical protein